MNCVVTNRTSWMFFSFTPGPDGVGGTFERSDQVVALSSDMRAVITGILKDMVSVHVYNLVSHSANGMFGLDVRQRSSDRPPRRWHKKFS